MLEKNPFVSLAGRLRAGLEEVHRLSSMVGTAMLAALHLVLNQFTFAVSQFLEIGFTFLATASAAYLYGPWLAGLMGIVADTLGYFLRPNGTYFPGWTLNEFLLGFLYGCWLYKKPVTLWRTFAACLSAVLLINLCLTPLWLHLVYGNAFVITGLRLVKNLIKLPIDTLLLSRTPRAGWREATSKLYVNPAVDTLIMRQIIEDYKPERRGSYQYSDTNFWLLKLIAEKVSGESLDRLTHALLSELGCTLSGYNPLQTCDMEHCVPTEDDHILNRGTVQGYVHDELGALMGGVGGNAGLFSTAKEMARFCEMMLNDGCYASRRILSQETIRLFTGSPLAERKIWRGLGFDKRDPASSPLGGTDSYGHTGFTGTIFWIDARAGLYMVFLSNAVCPTRVDNKLLSTSLRTKIWEAVKQGCR